MGGGRASEERRQNTCLSEASIRMAVAGPSQVPLRLQILHQGQLLRELYANASVQVSEGLALAATCSGLLLPPPFLALPPGARLCRGAAQPDSPGDGLAGAGGADDGPGEGRWARAAHQWTHCCQAELRW